MNRIVKLLLILVLGFIANFVAVSSASACGAHQKIEREVALGRLQDYERQQILLMKKINLQSRVIGYIVQKIDQRFSGEAMLFAPLEYIPELWLMCQDNIFARHDAQRFEHLKLLSQLHINARIIESLAMLVGVDVSSVHYDGHHQTLMHGKHWIGCYLDALARSQEGARVVIERHSVLLNFILAAIGKGEEPPLNFNFNIEYNPLAELKDLQEYVGRLTFSYDQAGLASIFARISELKTQLGISQRERAREEEDRRRHYQQIENEQRQRAAAAAASKIKQQSSRSLPNYG